MNNEQYTWVCELTAVESSLLCVLRPLWPCSPSPSLHTYDRRWTVKTTTSHAQRAHTLHIRRPRRGHARCRSAAHKYLSWMAWTRWWGNGDHIRGKFPSVYVISTCACAAERTHMFFSRPFQRRVVPSRYCPPLLFFAVFALAASISISSNVFALLFSRWQLLYIND